MASPAKRPGTLAESRTRIDYARGRFGGSRGEIHVYDNAGENIVEKFRVDGGFPVWPAFKSVIGLGLTPNYFSRRRTP